MGTLDVSDAVGDEIAGNVVAASDDDAEDITGPKQPPFSGFWFEDADIEDTNVDDPEVQAQVSTQAQGEYVTVWVMGWNRL